MSRSHIDTNICVLGDIIINWLSNTSKYIKNAAFYTILVPLINENLVNKKVSFREGFALNLSV